jgi:hypothetical protein
MTLLQSSAVVKRRRWTLLAIRAVATFMIVYGTMHVIRAIGIAFGLTTTGGGSFVQQLIGTIYSNNYNAFWHGFSIAIPGIVLAYLSRRISRWIVPVDVNECPACGYALQQLTTTRCPECGFSLGAPGGQSSSSPR